MLRIAVVLLVAFGVGMLGWLAVGALRFSDAWPWIAAIVIGALAAVATRRAIAWPAC